MKVNKKSLVIFCFLIWGLVFSLLATLIISLVDKKEIPMPTNEIILIETIKKVDIPNVVEDYNIDNYSNKMIKVRAKYGYRLEKEDADWIRDKIIFYAKKHNLYIKDAFIIVNIESDFRVRAYNRNGNAYGLCQITQSCLDEYNLKNRTKYTLDQMFNVDINLEIGFWYYNRIMTYYSKFPEYGISKISREAALRDSYIAYNIGITAFMNVGIDGRNSLREGIYPRNMYGFRKGDEYLSVMRYYDIAKFWS
jgi:soluble lytic murein transglycosylase-like protein